MQNFINKIKSCARINPKRIVFPEGSEERILKATAQIQKEQTASIILLGNSDLIKSKSKSLGLNLNFNKIEIHNPTTSSKLERYAEEFFSIRKHKPKMTEKKALEIIQKINYFGTMMVNLNEADGMVSGTTFSTADTIRPALQIIKTKENFHKVSGVFIMILQDRLMLFADTAVIIDPNSYELADITVDTINTAKQFGIIPKVAMLSFSTNGSAKHPMIDKVREATVMAKKRCPDTIIEGELQVDAAIIPEIAKQKSPNSKLKGEANILIFPDLQSGNISYKLVERLAKAHAIGPILQGLNKPINDLSRGCSYKNIVDITALTVCETQKEFAYHQITSTLLNLKPKI